MTTSSLSSPPEATDGSQSAPAVSAARDAAFETPTPELLTMHQAIVASEEELDTLRLKFLRKCGWDYACDTPGSYWVWTKEWHGRRYTCGTDLAISFQLGMWR
jgi:hypothetical protein